MIEEIIPNLYRIPVPLPDNPLRELNSYLIRGEDRSLLIDTGFRLPPCRRAMEEGLREAGADRSRLDILCTHIHTDHTGQCLDLIAPGRTIYIGAGDYPMTFRSYDAWFWDISDRRFSQEDFPPEEARVLLRTNPARTLGPDLERLSCTPLSDGDRLAVGDYVLEVIETPGHTPGGVCYHLPDDRLLLSGDTLFAGSVGRTDLPGGDMPTLMASLSKLVALPGDTIVVPGHGPETTIASERKYNPFLQR